MMIKRETLAHIFDDEIAWNTEQDAYEAAVHFSCSFCDDLMTFSIEKDGSGEVFVVKDGVLLDHITNLEQKYHGTARNVEKTCTNNHKQNLVFTFGETQPARYILTKAAVIYFS